MVAACSALLLTSPLAPPSPAGDAPSPAATAYPGVPGQGRAQQVPALPGAYTAFQTGFVGTDLCAAPDAPDPAPTAGRQAPAQCAPAPRPGP